MKKKHVLVYGINKILKVVLASGTAGLNSASKVLEPGFSIYVYQLLPVGSILGQNLSNGHNRHLFIFSQAQSQWQKVPALCSELHTVLESE